MAKRVTNSPWVSHYPSWVSPSLEYPRIPLYQLLDDSASRFPDRAAIIFYDGEKCKEVSRKTYRDLWEQSERLATALVDLGIQKGDRVACYLGNSPEAVASFFGILKAGAIVVPCNPMYRGRELHHQLTDCGAKAIICDLEGYPIVEEIRSSTAVEQVILTGDPPPGAPALSWYSLVATHPPLPSHPEVDVAQDVALIAYTGGTTGVPKGAALTHHNIVSNIFQLGLWFQYRPGEEVFISSQPLFHIGGISGGMSLPLSVGGTIILFRRFHGKGVLEAIQQYRVTRFPGAPTMYLSILNLEGASSFDLSSLRLSRTSAAPLPSQIKKSFDNLAGREVLVEGYGLTEASPVTHALPPQRIIMGSIGVPLPDTQARVVDAETGKVALPAGETGELVVRGPQVMKHYWNKPKETAEALRDGWLFTGDVARMDEDGYFYIVDRKKDMINAAGFKVWPRDVEEVLFRHPAVLQAAVIGVPDSYRGETVKAFIVLKHRNGLPPPAALEQDIVAFCRRELAAYKVPRIVEFTDSLPINTAGKTLRRVLRELPSGRPD